MFSFSQVIAENFTDSGNCSFKDEKGNEFSLLTLKKQDFWKVKDNSNGSDSSVFSMDYLFNFCEGPVSKVRV